MEVWAAAAHMSVPIVIDGHGLQAVVKATSGQGRGAKRKPQPTVRERLAKKLLSGKARGATVGEIQSAADERFQEVNSNRWQATRFP